MNWFYALNGQQAGPVEDAELDRLVQSGTINASTLVWQSGMAEWQPYSQARSGAYAAAGAAAPAALVGAGQEQCSQCGQVFPADDVVRVEGYNVCAACKPMLLQKLREGVSPAVGAYGIVPHRYGGFWIRFGAVFVDGLILMPFVYGPVIYVLATQGATEVNHLSIGWRIMQYLVPLAYESYFIGRYGATWGKMLCGLRVVRPDGSGIGYGRSVGRHFAKFLSGIILAIGYIMAGFDKEKRALHDYICDTRVVEKPSATGGA